MKTILITGGAGFVGSSLALRIKMKYPGYSVLSLDNLKRRGAELNVERLLSGGVKFIHGDIRNKEDFFAIEENVDVIIESSAEPSVLAGIGNSPDYLINTNLIGTINCLNFALKNHSDFIFLSTSRVYPIEAIEQINFVERETRFQISGVQKLPGVSEKGISESFSLNGYRSLYGASKLASEILIAEYNHFYRLRTIVNRCAVLTGPWQMGKVDQGVIVLWVARHYWKKGLSYIGYGGEGKQVRDILHIDDLFSLIDLQIHNPDTYNGQLFNVGGGPDISLSLQELTTLCQEVTGNRIPIEKVKENRPADIRIYLTDNTKVTSLSGWKPSLRKEQVVADVFNWIHHHERQLVSILS